jgi:hypothetical protein
VPDWQGSRPSWRAFVLLEPIDNHFWAIALHYMHYNFCQIQKSLRVTPAMEAGITDHAWSIEEIVDLLDRSDNIAA